MEMQVGWFASAQMDSPFEDVSCASSHGSVLCSFAEFGNESTAYELGFFVYNYM